MAKPGGSSSTNKVAKKTSAKKRASKPVKKTVANKKTTKKVAKKIAKNAPKKTARKAVKRKATKKASAKSKTAKATKKANIKVAQEKVAAKSANKLLSIKDNTETPPKEVTVPTNMSLRAKRKAEAIADLITKDFSASAWKVSYVAGVCFVLLGAFAGFTGLSGINGAQLGAQTAAGTNPISSSTQTQLQPVVDLVDPIPSPLETDNSYLVSVLHVETADFFLVRLDTGEEISLNVNRINNENYRVEIRASSLEPGRYGLFSEVESLGGIMMQSQTLASFEVLQQMQAEPVAIDLMTTIPEFIDSNIDIKIFVLYATDVEAYIVDKNDSTYTQLLPTIKLQQPGEYLVDIPAQNNIPPGEYELNIKGVADIDNEAFDETLGVFEVPEPDTSSATASSTPTSSSGGGSSNTGTSGTTNNTTASSTNTTNLLDDTLDKDDIKVEVKIYDSEFVAPNTIYVFAPIDSEFVRLYYRSETSTTRAPLGYAIKGADRWLFRLDTAKYPNGTYYISANAKHDGVVYKSPAEKIRIAVPVINTDVDEIPEPDIVYEPDKPEPIFTQDSPSLQDTEPEKTLEREVVTLNESDFSDLGDDEAGEQAKELFDTYREEIDVLLKRYAVAVQSGDSILVDAARRQLIQKRDEIMSQVLLNPELSNLADRINERLAKGIEDLQVKVETFEELRKTETRDVSSVDTDGDGISDVDERILFKTDPTVADSDNDGVNDGVEVLRGFDPLNAQPEAVVRYESPRESVAYVAEETLKVRAVKPVIRRDVNENNPPVSAEISGEALPNSFVTLYIFSTPTVVTIKTDNDGSFVYTFDDELEDGEHEVYVAVTDNTGAIVAQSNPFRFVKEAQAFTPEDESITPVVSSIDETISSNPYVSVLGLGILGLGLVLLMLGFALRTNEPKQVIPENLVA